MNSKFTIKGLEVKLPQWEADIKLGEIIVEINDLNLTEYFRCLKELPALIKETTEILQAPQQEEQKEIYHMLESLYKSISRMNEKVNRIARLTLDDAYTQHINPTRGADTDGDKEDDFNEDQE